MVVVGDRDSYPTVLTGAGIAVGWGVPGGAVSESFGLSSRHLVGQNFWPHERHRRFLLRDVYEHSFAGLASMTQGGHQHPRGVRAGDGVAVIYTRLHGPFSPVSGHVSHSGELLLSDAVAQVSLPGTGITEGRHRYVDQVWPVLAQFVIGVTQSLEAPLPEILDHNVTDRNESLEDLLAFGFRQFQSHTVLGHVQAVEPAIAVPGLFARFSIWICGDARGRTHRTPVRVVNAKRLHLDDLGAHVGKEFGAVWPGPDAREVQDPVVLEGHTLRWLLHA